MNPSTPSTLRPANGGTTEDGKTERPPSTQLRKAVFGGALLFLLFAGDLQAQPSQSGGGSGKGAGPRLGIISQVEITITNRADLERLVQAGYDVDGVESNRITVYADNDELASLSGEGWQTKILKLPPTLPGPVPAKALGDYNNYADMTAMLDAYATNFPSLCRKVSIGKSVQNRDLWALVWR